MTGTGAQPGPRARDRPRTRVVVVVTSATLSARLVSSLAADADISVIGESATAIEAADLVAKLVPDVLILELAARPAAGEHAQQAIQRIMGSTPTPILVLAAEGTDSRSACTVEALRAGAVEVLAKPTVWTSAFEADVRRRVRILRGVTVLRHRSDVQRAVPSRPEPPSRAGRAGRVVGIAASTGGPAALAEIMAGLGGMRSPVLVVQHIHIDFIDGLVTWMARVAPMPVEVAVHGRALVPGVVYIGPGDVHLKVGPDRSIVLDSEPVTTHRPSGDQLLLSMAENLGPDGIGVVLTGMGSDGTAGLLALRQRGGVTMCQDEESSVVFGMPRAAQSAGAAAHVLPLSELANALLTASRGVLL